MKCSRLVYAISLVALMALGAFGCGTDPPACPAGQTQCGTQCFNLQTASDNCGACGTVCGAGEVCGAGVCAVSCPGTLTDCEGTCVDSNVDEANCGGCGIACAAGEVCQAGVCGTSCPEGLQACDGACVDTASNPGNCGECGVACDAGEVCGMGACAPSCPPNLSDCEGACVDTRGDEANCGGCGVTCDAGQACVAGTCELSCGAGAEVCDGACVDTSYDRRHCGGCGVECAAGEVCNIGTCTLSCQDGFNVCDDTCVDFQTNPDYCGDCLTACADGELCQMGSCVTSCEPGREVCEGACVDTQTSDLHCGGCGVMCADGEECAMGGCVDACLPGDSRCDGQCVNTDADPLHCGGCGVMCGAGESCVEGACAPCTDCPRFATVVGGGSNDVFNAVAVDSAGNIYAAGRFAGVMQIGDQYLTSENGTSDGLLIKFSPTGRYIWHKIVSGISLVELNDVAVDAMDNVYVTGNYAGSATLDGNPLPAPDGADLLVISFDSTGATRWSNTLNGTGTDIGNSIAIDPVDGDVVVVGRYSGSVSTLTSAGGNDVLAWLLDSNGVEKNLRGFGSTSTDEALAVTIDGASNIYVTGYFSFSVNWGTNIDTTSTGSRDIFVARLSDNLEPSWVAAGGGSSGDDAEDIIVGSDGNIYVVGDFINSMTIGATMLTNVGDNDIFLASIDASGAWNWATSLGSGGADSGLGLAESNASLYVVGVTSGSITFQSTKTPHAGGNDILISQFDLSGNIQGVTTAGGTATDQALAIASGNSNDFYVAGQHSNVANIGLQQIYSLGGSDAFIARYDAVAQPLCPTTTHEICGGQCTFTASDINNCGGCGITCNTAATELCFESMCVPTPVGLVYNEINVGAPDYVVLENTTQSPLDTSGIYVYMYASNAGTVDAMLPSRTLAPGEKVYFIENGGALQAGEERLGDSIPYVTSSDFHALLCFGPCDLATGGNILDAMTVDAPNDSLPSGITFTPAGVPNVTNDITQSYLRVGNTGTYPNFQQSDWTVGASTR